MNLRSYEQRRADDPMIVLEEEMEEQPKYEKRSAQFTGKQPWEYPLANLTPDQQIRMKALECCSAYAHHIETGSSEDAFHEAFWAKVLEFEDYLKKGRSNG